MKISSERYAGIAKVLLLILPLLYLIAGSYFRNLLGNLSLRSCDPEYIYFMSGLTLSDGAIRLGHFDNPGTPLQILMALLFRLVWYIRSTSLPFVEDVLSHPDLYLSVTSLVITGLTAALITYTGLQVYKHSRSVVYALLIQTAPFLPVIWYDLIGRVAPELMMPFPVMLLTLLMVKIHYSGEATTTRQILAFALISALGLSIKLTFLPLWALPFLITSGWKNKLKFVAFSFLFFFIIAFPVSLQMEFFWNWVKNLFLHSGQYGGGESNIINFATLKSNLTELYNYERRFFLLFFALITVFAIYLGLKRGKADRKISWMAAGLILAISLQLIMVGKHYAHRYFIPVLMLMPLTVFLAAELIRKMAPFRVTSYVLSLLVLLTVGWNIRNHRQWLPVKTNGLSTDIKSRMPTWHFVSLLDKQDNYKIITSQNYGSPFIEYTLTYSLVWANHQKRTEYAPVLDRLYPHTFNYFTWDNTLKSWVEKFDAKIIAGSGKKVFLYLERDEEELFNRTLSKLAEESETPFTHQRELLYRNPATTEVIYQLFLTLTEPESGEYKNTTE
jgi:hypothetical protein